MDLELDRVREVASRLNLLSPKAKVITVSGTNGKGSSTAMLSAIYTHAGYLTGWYSSPHIWRYNERVRVNNMPVSDAALIRAFETIENAREEITLTVFEWGTLAALWLFAQAKCNVIILEVGLGGRLDATNILDADVALITAIDIDHPTYLGADRTSIAREKAGIMRAGKPAVVSDVNPPSSLFGHAHSVGVSSLLQLGRDYAGYLVSIEYWVWHDKVSGQLLDLPRPNLQGDFQLMNASGVIAVTQLLQEDLPVSRTQIAVGLTRSNLQGRLQRINKNGNTWLLDIAHNPQAVQSLLDYLKREHRKIHIIFSALEDKDIVRMMQLLNPLVARWWIAPLYAPRAASQLVLETSAQRAGLTHVTWCDSIDIACQSVQDVSRSEEILILACGSFVTVEQVGHWLGVDRVD
jgi:dihydrofolate synthase/folylpolyglutamate synthase